MRISPVSNNSNSFKGLWAWDFKVKNTYDRTSVRTYRNFYYPFADEDPSAIQKVLKEKNFTFSSAEGGLGSEVIISRASIVKKLSFTEKEYNAYKNSREKEMTDSVRKVEKELKNKKLWSYLNSGLSFKLKKFGYLFKKAVKSVGQTFVKM